VGRDGKKPNLSASTGTLNTQHLKNTSLFRVSLGLPLPPRSFGIMGLEPD
jgi:hypothetical protein